MQKRGPQSILAMVAAARAVGISARVITVVVGLTQFADTASVQSSLEPRSTIRRLAESCNLTDIKRRTDTIAANCCYQPDGTPFDCSSGPPVSCSAVCASVFIPFWSDCRDAGIFEVSDMALFDAFAGDCQLTNDNNPQQEDAANAMECHVLRSEAGEATFEWVEISPLQMDHCIGSTIMEQTACGIPPPRIGITADDVGVLIGVDDWTSDGLSIWAADDGW